MDMGGLYDKDCRQLILRFKADAGMSRKGITRQA
jgi:hypothetical protein